METDNTSNIHVYAAQKIQGAIQRMQKEEKREYKTSYKIYNFVKEYT